MVDVTSASAFLKAIPLTELQHRQVLQKKNQTNETSCRTFSPGWSVSLQQPASTPRTARVPALKPQEEELQGAGNL